MDASRSFQKYFNIIDDDQKKKTPGEKTVTRVYIESNL